VGGRKKSTNESKRRKNGDGEGQDLGDKKGRQFANSRQWVREEKVDDACVA
jgi:hypothetical protein